MACCGATKGMSSGGIEMEGPEPELNPWPPNPPTLAAGRVRSISARDCQQGKKVFNAMSGNAWGCSPASRLSISWRTSLSKMFRSLHTSTTLLNFPWISAEAPLYPTDAASAMKGEKAVRKSSLCRALDCCTTSVDGLAATQRCLQTRQLTIGKINHVQPLRAREILELGQPQVDRL